MDSGDSRTIYNDMCRGLSDEHEQLYSVQCEFTPIVENGVIKIKCDLCSIMITPGLIKQRLQNVRRHFTESTTHKSNVVEAAGRKNVSSESIANMEINASKKIMSANKLAPGTFSIVAGDEGRVLCHYCIGDKRYISLNPKHGSFENNIKCHLKSQQRLKCIPAL